MTRRTVPLSPDEAVRRIERDRESVMFPLADFGAQFGLTNDEVLAELRAGRLRAVGVRTERGYEDCAITFGAVARWLADPRSPQPLVARVYAMLRRENPA